MHILLIHQAFVTTGEAGGTRHAELARRLVSHGHRVTVITSPQSYLTGETKADLQNEVSEPEQGLTIRYAYTSQGYHRGFFSRLNAFFSFMFSSIREAGKVKDVDLVWGTSPNLFQALSAWLIAKRKGRKFLLEIRDLWPEFAIGMGVLKNKVLIRASLWLEKFLYKRADQIIVNSPGFIPHIQKICGKTAVLIPNAADPKMFESTDHGETLRRQWQLEDQFVVMYTGAHGPANDLQTVLAAAEQLKEDRRIRFVLVGSGKEKDSLIAQAQQKQLENVMFILPVAKSGMADVIAASDAGLAILKAIPAFKTTYPNKVFDFMAAGKAVICQIDGVIREVVEKYDAGIFVPPGDAGALARAVTELANDSERCRRMGENGLLAIQQDFSREKTAGAFEALLEQMIHKK